MAKETQRLAADLNQKERLALLALYLLSLLLVGRLATGEFVPSDSGQRLWLLSGIALWFFVLISAPWFSPPRDALANSFTAALLLSLLDFRGVASLGTPLSVFRWVGVGIASVTSICAIVAMALKDTDPIAQPRRGYASIAAFRLSGALGHGAIVFTPPALISIVGYYQSRPDEQLWLLFAWVFLVAVRPFDLALLAFKQIRSIGLASQVTTTIGLISRVDNPDIVRVTLERESAWEPKRIVIACLPNGEQVCVLPLFHHVQEAGLVGTGLCCGFPESAVAHAVPGHVYRARHSTPVAEIIKTLSGVAGAQLIGFVVEDASIATLRFEVSPEADLHEGMIVFCRQGEDTVYYQILDARTVEETFESNPRGKHVAIATQLGCIDKDRCFVKYSWLPPMNAPVFTAREPVGDQVGTCPDDEFELGRVPGSSLTVRACLPDLVEFHAAIIGATGTGKTELALDIIRRALASGMKVFCVDFTGEYRARLSDYQPQSLSLDEAKVRELDAKLFAVDTGTYGAPAEKKALKEFLDAIREPVRQTVTNFLEPEGPSLGVFELPEITNTKATLRATELYLSSIMQWSRRNRRARRILVVLEEAHTIIPETTWAGFDADTIWVVGRVAQIALQGRKYGVGLLVISQRTALVSKSILSQCNTHITFSLVDKTSLDYLANVYSPEHVRAIPNLRFLQAMAYGKAIRSQRPVLFEIEYEQAKRDASAQLEKPAPSSPASDPWS